MSAQRTSQASQPTPQERRVAELMEMKIGDWPPGLKGSVQEYIEEHGKCGETCAEAIRVWVNAHERL